MTLFFKTVFSASLFLLLSCSIKAEGVSPYLPLKLDNLIELDINRLASIAKLPSLTKPYHIVTVVQYLEKVKNSHPTLYGRLSNYIKRYKQQSGITHFSVELGHSFSKNKQVANQRGMELENTFQGSFTSFAQYNQYFIANAGGSFSENNDIIAHNSYLSFGNEYAQFDLGYREHWLSPMQESASLLSTNAKPTPSITLSNVKPLTHWNIKYEMSVALLTKMAGIHFNDTITDGKPGLLTMHLSVQPFDWWTIGANRTFMFGGGERRVNLGDIWNAIKDPVNSDNCGGTDLVDCDQEVGNQIASLTSKFDFSLYQHPLSLYLEYAGEDTKQHQNYQLGNIAYTYGVFLPYLSESTSVYLEHSVFHSAWYVHHLYDEGYRNSGTIMGHWWANEKLLKDGSGASASSFRFNWDVTPENHLEMKLRTIKISSINQTQNNRFKEIEINLKHVYKSGFIGLSLNVGKDTFGDPFSRASISYNW